MRERNGVPGSMSDKELIEMFHRARIGAVNDGHQSLVGFNAFLDRRPSVDEVWARVKGSPEVAGIIEATPFSNKGIVEEARNRINLEIALVYQGEM